MNPMIAAGLAVAAFLCMPAWVNAQELAPGKYTGN
jgi:hypothetical protein